MAACANSWFISFAGLFTSRSTKAGSEKSDAIRRAGCVRASCRLSATAPDAFRWEFNPAPLLI